MKPRKTTVRMTEEQRLELLVALDDHVIRLRENIVMFEQRPDCAASVARCREHLDRSLATYRVLSATWQAPAEAAPKPFPVAP